MQSNNIISKLCDSIIIIYLFMNIFIILQCNLISNSNMQNEQGILFSEGLFYDHDAAFSYVTFQYRVDS